MKPVLLVIAGPNGAGKTTVTTRLRAERWSEGVEYLNPDEIARDRFGDWNSPDAILQAAQWATERREALLAQGAGIAFETVLSTAEKIDFLARAKAAGHFIRVFFIATSDPRINAARVADRVLAGGHAVPIDKILSRHVRAIGNLGAVIALADRVYLTPLVTALKGTPGLYSYEIFNEPEGMSTTGWATKWKIDISYIQKAVNQWSAAIHAADPTVLVTNGSQTMDYRTKYTDAALTGAGGKANGTLDFYEVHFYQSNGQGNNVFANPRSHWGLSDKKLVIGEFSIDGTSPVAGNDSYTYLFNNGYDGGWSWAYTADNKWPSMQKPLNNLYTAQKATIDACP